ncbi:MAG: CarD family transcriptional regulator, partial [Lachnospiraceae bacterium]|nr:CarD family transcriptional regulator [Lachnospiraceae bacterium]
VLHVCKMKGERMFEIGELIIYGGNGVCRVEKIGPIDTGMGTKGRMYYTLNPLKNKDSRIFTPVDNEKVIMRPTMTKEDALALIDQIQNVETLWIGDERRRETEYKEAVRKCDCREYVKIIKTIYLRKEARLADGKKVTAVDERYYAIAEENLYGELAVALGMDRDQTKIFVEQRVKELAGK